MNRRLLSIVVAVLALLPIVTGAISVPTRAQRGMVASQNEAASKIGADVIAAGGSAVDAAVAQFSKNGVPYEQGEVLRQPDLARTLERIATQGPAGFYEGESALALEKEMLAHGGLITRDDLKKYAAKRRTPVKGTYRGYEV